MNLGEMLNMKILMLSWEYPPKNVGGLSNHVFYLSHALRKLGHEVHVITCEEGDAPVEENNNGVYVHRVTPYKIDTEDFSKWVMHLNFAMIEEATRLINYGGKFDLIHAHDWLSAFTAKALKWSFKIPMVSTIHATEYGRNGGIRTDMQRYISSTEWFLTYESWKVVACSNYMRQQVKDLFGSPWDKIWVIPNGVEPQKFNFNFDSLEFRRNYAEDNEKIIFYVGRHVFEKGIHLLVEAARGIVKSYNNSKFVIAGTGPMTEELKNRVRDMGIEKKVLFVGYMNDEDRDKLYKVADVAVFPSLYEPFGIVALEAMAAGCPVVVSNTGGLGEIIEHKVNGLKSINGSSESITDNVSQLLYDNDLANILKENALKTVYEKYTWNKVAELTVEMYELVREEAKGTEWEMKREEHKYDTVARITEEVKDKIKNNLIIELKDKVEKELKESVEKNLINKLRDRVEEKLRVELKDKVMDELKENLAIEGLRENLKEKVENTKEAVENIASKTIETVDNIAEIKNKVTKKVKRTVKGGLGIKIKEIVDDENSNIGIGDTLQDNSVEMNLNELSNEEKEALGIKGDNNINSSVIGENNVNINITDAQNKNQTKRKRAAVRKSK
jgi:glycosyltransferase involved in cell wall biosynthesis